MTNQTTQIPTLDFRQSAEYTPAIWDYFRYYGLDIPVEHHFGTFDSSRYRLTAHVFIPDSPRGTVIFVHGYLDHVGMVTRMARFCIDNHLAFAGFDLPGHGLSTGECGNIGEFSGYVDALKSFLNLCSGQVPAPLLLCGHSTGGAIALDYLLEGGMDRIDKVVLVAPLVRCRMFRILRSIHFLLCPIIRTTPRWYGDFTSDREFAAFYRSDPLQCRRFPVAWATAYFRWYNSICSRGALDAEISIIQGTRDGVVDWRYNIPFLRRKISRASVFPVRGGRHHLINEGSPFGQWFYRIFSEMW